MEKIILNEIWIEYVNLDERLDDYHTEFAKIIKKHPDLSEEDVASFILKKAKKSLFLFADNKAEVDKFNQFRDFVYDKTKIKELHFKNIIKNVIVVGSAIVGLFLTLLIFDLSLKHKIYKTTLPSSIEINYSEDINLNNYTYSTKSRVFKRKKTHKINDLELNYDESLLGEQEAIFSFGNYSFKSTVTIAALQLKTPTASLTNNKLNWNKVENADKYIVKINDIIVSTTNNYFDLSSYLNSSTKLLVKLQSISDYDCYEDSSISTEMTVVAVNFKTEHGNDSRKLVVVGQNYGTLPSFDVSGYIFIGWFLDDTPVNKNTIVEVNKSHNLTAIWVQGEYTITYKIDNKIFGDIERYSYGDAISLKNDPTKEGYTFLGWENYTKSNFPKTMPAENIVVIGNFKKNLYMVEFETNGGTIVLNDDVYFSEKITVPEESEKYGYIFAGWFKNKQLTQQWYFENDKMPANNITLYAKWKIKDVYLDELERPKENPIFKVRKSTRQPLKINLHGIDLDLLAENGYNTVIIEFEYVINIHNVSNQILEINVGKESIFKKTYKDFTAEERTIFIELEISLDKLKSNNTYINQFITYFGGENRKFNVIKQTSYDLIAYNVKIKFERK